MYNNTKIENISLTLAKIINAKKFMATLTIKVMINIITKIKLIITITEKKNKYINNCNNTATKVTIRRQKTSNEEALILKWKQYLQ